MLGIKVFVAALVLALGMAGAILVVHLRDTAAVQSQANSDVDALRERIGVHQIVKDDEQAMRDRLARGAGRPTRDLSKW